MSVTPIIDRDPEARAKLETMARSGATAKELAKEFGVGVTTVRRWKKALGLPSGKPGNPGKAKPGRGKIRGDKKEICLNCTAPRCSGWCEKMRGCR